MRYKVFVSDDEGSYESFYCDREGQAQLLFNMAKNSQMFSYVCFSKTIDEDICVNEWVEEDI